MSHSDQVTKLPQSLETCIEYQFKVLHHSKSSKHFYGIQFHPEVTHKNGIIL